MLAPRLLPLFLLLSPLGCDDDAMDADPSGTESGTGADESSGGEPTVDEQAIAEQAIDFESLTKLNDEPLSSQHGLAVTMNMWVSPSAASAYAELGDGTVFDPGTYLLKEQLDADGALDSVAVMYKGPAGYSPDSGDWWFGLVNPDGTVRLGGQPGGCVDCHSAVESQDWAWGLPE